MGSVKAIYKYFTWLSIDVALGAICVQHFASRLQSTDIHWSATSGLFTAIWSIYLIDHFIDIKDRLIVSPRRLFHREHKKLIVGLIVINIIFGAVSFIFLPREVKMWGLALAAGCLFYFPGMKLIGGFKVKELVVAIFYTLGIFLVLFINGSLVLNVYMASQVFLLAFINLLVFSVFEFEADLAEAFDSLPTAMGQLKTIQLIYFLAGILLLSIFIYTWYVKVPLAFEAFIFIAWLALVVLLFKRHYFSQEDRYRMVGDAIFFIPLVLLW